MFTAIALSCTLLAAQPPQQSQPASVALQHCLVSLINEAQVPSKEHGVLMELVVKEGQAVRAGDTLAKIDDIDAQAALRVADFKLRQAKEEAASDIYVRYAKASAEVARANYQSADEACKRMPNTFSQTEMREKWLIWNRATLEIEKSEMDNRIMVLKSHVAEAELDVAKESVERRVIRSPIDGVVEEIHRHVGEWVQPGDPVVHVLRIDRVRIEGFVNSEEVSPAEVVDRPVVVTATLARGQRETFTGQVTHVKSSDQAGKVFRVWAEVDNRQQNGQPMLRPGAEAEMTIKVR